MGGIGSGRYWYYDAKNTTEYYRNIDIRSWHREGFLTPYQSFIWKWCIDGETIASIQVRIEPSQVILTYRYKQFDEEWVNESHTVHIDWTNCNFGGKRPWFICPVKGCGKRVAILYGSNIFSCRHCNQLAYQSQREPADERAIRRAEKIRKNLNWKPGVLNDMGNKPKSMHWKTFERLTTQYNAFLDESLSDLITSLNLF